MSPSLHHAIPRRAGRAVAFALALVIAAPAAAEGTCRQWQAPALMQIKQDTLGGLQIDLQLKQNGSQLLGFAQYQTTRKTVIGKVVGDITGDGIHLRVLWTYGGDPSIGRYVGKIVPRVGGIVGDTQYGYVFQGTTYDEYRVPPEYVSWTAYHFTCKLEAPPPPVALGRVDTRGSAPTPICVAARSAKARNSPAAPGLERQCLASGGSMSAPTLTDPDPADPLARARTVPGVVVSADPSGARVDALAVVGAAMAPSDPELASARVAADDAAYQRGFDIASGLFGDPALGAQGNTLMGPGSARIRDSLDAAGQAGFTASVAFHLARTYVH